MPDRQALFDQLLHYLQSTPDLPDYLSEPPDPEVSFDPYQMVSEWIALRQEMKQQGKLLQTAQERLQRELDTVRSQNDELQQQLATSQKQASTQYAADLAAQEKRWSKEQESLLRGLLNVMDALDRACTYWQEQAEPLETASIEKISSFDRPKTLRQKVALWLGDLSQKLASVEGGSTDPNLSLTEILNSDRAGVELIRRNLLDLLKQQQVIPMQAQGKPFNSQYMYAIGRQASDVPENTVIQEVVRGYWQGDRVLREAQVIVSTGKPDQ